MSKKVETIQKYKDAYLEGKSDRIREKFFSKDLERQYQSIMTWRYNQRRKLQDAVGGGGEVLTNLRKVKKIMEKSSEMSEQILNEISTELTAIGELVGEASKRRQMLEIERLEQEKEKIAGRLEELRRQVYSPED